MIASIIIVLMYVFGLGVMLALHGNQRDDKYSFWGFLISILIMFALYYFAGMFNWVFDYI